MDTLWKLFVMGWVALVAVSCGAGFASVLNPVTYNTTTNYSYSYDYEFNILSGNTDTVAVIGICIVLVLVVRSLRSGGNQ